MLIFIKIYILIMLQGNANFYSLKKYDSFEDLSDEHLFHLLFISVIQRHKTHLLFLIKYNTFQIIFNTDSFCFFLHYSLLSFKFKISSVLYAIERIRIMVDALQGNCCSMYFQLSCCEEIYVHCLRVVIVNQIVDLRKVY